MIYAFIAEHDEYSVARWAGFFGVSRSGYYAYIGRRKQRETDESAYKAQVRAIFEESDGTYGPDRICGILRNRGRKASYQKVSRMMAEMGLSPIHNRHKTRSLTNSQKSRGDGFANLVRGQIFDRPGQAVCSDITYLKCWRVLPPSNLRLDRLSHRSLRYGFARPGWLYLCVVKDIVTKEILGEAYSERMTKELVVQAFLNAQARHNLAAGTIFHSDRGSQYTSKDFMSTLELYGIKQSFSRVGMPGDNAWAESFFATLKKECIAFKHFAAREGLKASVFAWINTFYNTGRVQAALGYISPRAFAAQLMARIKAA